MSIYLIHMYTYTHRQAPSTDTRTQIAKHLPPSPHPTPARTRRHTHTHTHTHARMQTYMEDIALLVSPFTATTHVPANALYGGFLLRMSRLQVHQTLPPFALPCRDPGGVSSSCDRVRTSPAVPIPQQSLQSLLLVLCLFTVLLRCRRTRSLLQLQLLFSFLCHFLRVGQRALSTSTSLSSFFTRSCRHGEGRAGGGGGSGGGGG